ncbi:MAG: hypothetical protein ACJA2C_002198 [Marinoscillum sp.]|jgi:hypothetical protein
MPEFPFVYISDEVKAVRSLYEDLIPKRYQFEYWHDFIEQVAERIYHGHRANLHGAYVEISNGCERFMGKSISDIFNSEFTMYDALMTASRLHGYPDWESISTNKQQANNKGFEEGLLYLLSGDEFNFKKLLSHESQLANQKSTLGHGATLLHYCASNGIETYHQVVPKNLPEMARLLIDHGADRHLKMHIYDGDFTAKQLAESSSHPKVAGIMDALLKVLS